MLLLLPLLMLLPLLVLLLPLLRPLLLLLVVVPLPAMLLLVEVPLAPQIGPGQLFAGALDGRTAERPELRPGPGPLDARAPFTP